MVITYSWRTLWNFYYNRVSTFTYYLRIDVRSMYIYRLGCNRNRVCANKQELKIARQVESYIIVSWPFYTEQCSLAWNYQQCITSSLRDEGDVTQCLRVVCNCVEHRCVLWDVRSRDSGMRAEGRRRSEEARRDAAPRQNGRWWCHFPNSMPQNYWDQNSQQK